MEDLSVKRLGFRAPAVLGQSACARVATAENAPHDGANLRHGGGQIMVLQAAITL